MISGGVPVLVLLDLDPNVVKPGWTPLLITIGIGVVIALLFVSMRRQFRRIDVTQSQPFLVEQPEGEPVVEAPDAVVEPKAPSPVDRPS